MTHTRILSAAALTLLGTAAVSMLSAQPADAGRWRPGPERDAAYAESRFGNGRVSGPVRSTSTGYEVRLPGGTWIACRRSCSETLRVSMAEPCREPCPMRSATKQKSRTAQALR
jgi:hypothetical protein